MASYRNHRFSWVFRVLIPIGSQVEDFLCSLRSATTAGWGKHVDTPKRCRNWMVDTEHGIHGIHRYTWYIHIYIYTNTHTHIYIRTQLHIDAYGSWVLDVRPYPALHNLSCFFGPETENSGRCRWAAFGTAGRREGSPAACFEVYPQILGPSLINRNLHISRWIVTYYNSAFIRMAKGPYI